ncbi:MAG: ABC transporter ATP-binding protein [Cereibacter sphaeroides]|uniref:ABC transporter ATP-binding protein n=1 Tax=Cereibacter sphaeroides TaxID=1063 RepID=A0A2W5S497_CERSP|nr:MAG: ABC transporter ATP-binding protein [Cereibacter sphaeroides]
MLTQQERKRFFVLLGLIIMMGFVEMVGVASILPFLAAVSNPDAVQNNRYMAALYNFLGLTDYKTFLVVMGLSVFVMIIFSMVVKIATTYATTRFSQMRTYSLSSRLLAGYLRQPYSWFLNRHSAQLSRSILNEVSSVIGGSLIPAMKIIAQSVSLIFLIGLLFVVNPAVAASTIVIFIGAYTVIFLGFRNRLTAFGTARLEANRLRFRVASEIFGAAKEIKLLGLEDRYLMRFQAPSRRIAEIASSSQIIGEMPRNLLEAITYGGILLLIVVLLVTGDGAINSVLPTLGVFAFAGLKIFPAVQQMYQSLTALRSNAPTLESIHKEYMETIAQDRTRTAPSAGKKPLHITDRIEMRDIGYQYPVAEKAALRGLSLTIRANTTVGIVGGTGAGKTTAVDVLLGLLTPQSGQLLVDGAPVTEENVRNWQKVLGYVPQHIFLIDSSVSANIAFGVAEKDWDHAAIERAARIANLHDFIMGDLPQGYETRVGERGVRLSGGQRQRIGIARALYHNPEVLIMDEATSALDNLTERAVMEAVQNLRHAKTVIMIAHRLTTVKNCDTIFLLQEGQVMGQGTYDELREENETFRRMVGT